MDENKNKAIDKFIAMNDLRILLSQLTSYDTTHEEKMRLILEGKRFSTSEIYNLDFVKEIINGELENSDEVIFSAFQLVYDKLTQGE